MKELVIIGAGGFGREVLAWAKQSPDHHRAWKIKGFIDDNPQSLAGKGNPAPWLGTIQEYRPSPQEVFVCAMGNPAVKRKCSESIASRGGQFITLVHPTVVLGDQVQLGEGVILCPYAVVSGYNKLGRGVAINMHSTIDHDACVGDWTQVNCHCDLTGGVEVGAEVWFSSHVSVAPGIKIGDRAYLGMGSAIMRNVEADTKVFGVPARRIE